MVFPAISRRTVVRYPGQTLDVLSMIPKKRFDADDQIRLLEERFANYVGAAHALAVSSGRVSLETILMALNLPKGGEVILPAYTYHSVPEAIANVGLVPVFADVLELDNNLSPELTEKKITDKTVAILATHIFGHPCRLDALTEICQAHNLVLLEDCAHTLGGTFSGRQVGTFGKAAFFSFGATKVFNTYGGGMITTDDDALAEKMRGILAAYRPADKKGLVKTIASFSLLHFLTRRWPFTLTIWPSMWLIDKLKIDLLKLYAGTFKKTAESISVPVKYSNLQARLALAQLDRLEDQNRMRRQNAEALQSLLYKDIPRLTPVEGAQSVWYFFAIGMPAREKAAKELFARGLDTGQKIMDDCAALAGSTENFPVTRWWRRHAMQIPIHPPLRPDDMADIAREINRVYDQLKTTISAKEES